MKVKSESRGKEYLLYDGDLIDSADAISFSEEILDARGILKGSSPGRGGSSAYFFDLPNTKLILKHYRRGGLIAPVLGDRYLWQGYKRTRPYREWRLLSRLFESGLPVPQPVAMRVVRAGVFYRGDIVTQRIDKSVTLSRSLEAAVLAESEWRAVGRLIRRFHDHNLYHADLNASNLLIAEDGQLYLIDFDKSFIREAQDGWKQANLMRLQRSLLKLRDLRSPFHYRDSDWDLLEEGYSSGN